MLHDKYLDYSLILLQSMYSLYHRLTDELVPRTKRTVRVMNYGPITPLRDIKANYMGVFLLCAVIASTYFYPMTGQLISLRGTVVRVSTVLPIVKQVTFICMNCRALITEVFLDGKVRTPSKCSVYGCKGKTFIPDRGMFHATKTVDWQRVR